MANGNTFKSLINDIKGSKTQKELAADLGVSPTTISRWLRKPTNIKMSSAEALNRVCPAVDTSKAFIAAASDKQYAKETGQI